MNYPIPGKLPHFSSPKTPGNGVDPDDAQIPDDQDADLDDDLDDDDEDDIDDDDEDEDDKDDEASGDEGIDDPHTR